MVVKIGINGFGRIGRLVCRIALERDDVDIVAINNPFTDINYLAYQFKYDSVHGTYPHDVNVKDNKLLIGTKAIQVYFEKEPSNIPWSEHNVDVVCESSGVFTTTDLRKHIG